MIDQNREDGMTKHRSFFVKITFMGIRLLFIFITEVQCYKSVILFYFFGNHQVFFEKTVAVTMTYRTRIAKLLTHNHF